MNWLWLTGVVVVFDQVTKQIAEARLQYAEPAAVIDGILNFTLVYNKGVAFSFLSDAGGWQRWFFMALSAAISVVIFLWLKNVARENRILACGLALVLGGAIGNLIDRTLFGHVIDFVQYYYQADSCLIGFSQISYSFTTLCYWPAFNVADAAISLGAVCLVVDIFREQKNA